MGMEEVAKQAGVSIASVSRVLAGKSVREDVRQRVLTAVEHLSYRPNRVARSLRSNRSTTVGLIVADIQNTYFTQVCRAAEDIALARGFAVFLCNSDEDPAKEAHYLGLLRDENVAGVIVAPTAQTLRRFDPGNASAMPIVVIDRPTERARIDTVVIDNVAAAFDLTSHLLSHGRRRIAGLFGAKSATARERHRGFVDAHLAAGLTPIEELTRFVPPREQAGFEAMNALLASAGEPPDALLASNGLLGAGAFRALTQSKHRCPADIAFATFDDTTWATLVVPPVTVLQQPTHEIGRTAMELLLARVADPNRPTRNVILPHQLICRQSCGCGQPVVPA